MGGSVALVATLGLSRSPSCCLTLCPWAASLALVYRSVRAKGVPGCSCFPWEAGSLLVRWAVYSITLGNSLTSLPAALLGSRRFPR